MKTYYEWTMETIEDGDIIDADFSDLLTFVPSNNQRIGLRRYTGNNSLGITNVSYAYPNDGELPSHFDDGNVVPSRYRSDYINWLTN